MNRLAPFAVALLLLPVPVRARDVMPLKVLTGMVVGVSDGDTIKVLDDGAEVHKVRLFAIDAPERKQAYGSRAKQALSSKIFNKDVRVEWRERDRYGRIVGTVFLDGRNVNLEMVEEGWAWHYKHYDRSPKFAEAERKAREKRLGLWADKDPLPPWEFRKREREARQ